MMAAMPRDAKPSSEQRMLVNKLSVKDARHLLRLAQVLEKTKSSRRVLPASVPPR